jgi:hypothetical protein
MIESILTRKLRAGQLVRTVRVTRLRQRTKEMSPLRAVIDKPSRGRHNGPHANSPSHSLPFDKPCRHVPTRICVTPRDACEPGLHDGLGGLGGFGGRGRGGAQRQSGVFSGLLLASPSQTMQRMRWCVLPSACATAKSFQVPVRFALPNARVCPHKRGARNLDQSGSSEPMWGKPNPREWAGPQSMGEMSGLDGIRSFEARDTDSDCTTSTDGLENRLLLRFLVPIEVTLRFQP